MTSLAAPARRPGLPGRRATPGSPTGIGRAACAPANDVLLVQGEADRRARSRRDQPRQPADPCAQHRHQPLWHAGSATGCGAAAREVLDLAAAAGTAGDASRRLPQALDATPGDQSRRARPCRIRQRHPQSAARDRAPGKGARRARRGRRRRLGRRPCARRRCARHRRRGDRPAERRSADRPASRPSRSASAPGG